MNLECLDTFITDNLAIHIDLTSLESWDLNTGFTSFSITKWTGAVSDNINLMDFGLTEFDNGRTNVMWDGITLTPQDNMLSMYRVGYNEIENPTTGETSGVTVTTQFDLYPMSAITTGTSGNYFELNGGYLQGFFKLKDYNYEVFPARYNNGITIETLLHLETDSQGIFYMMGARSEDKYNPYFSGETITGGSTTIGVNSSEDNYLNAFVGHEETKNAFAMFEDKSTTVYSEAPPLNNIKNNAIAFEITQDKRLAYKYVDNDGLVVTNKSRLPIHPATGWTLIAISFTPDGPIADPDLLECADQRLGVLVFYVNGRAIWTLKDFPEFYFKAFENQKEKQIGEPYSMSWGGGSFGLKHSWHYDYQEYIIYKGQDTLYIESAFHVEGDPIPTECNPNPSGDYKAGLTMSADTTTFYIKDPCTDVEEPMTVMSVHYTGATGATGATGNSYYIKFAQPISVLSNRDYTVELSMYDGGFFNSVDENGGQVRNRVSIIPYGTVDIDITDETEYAYPLTLADIEGLQNVGLEPFPDKQDFQWIVDQIMYYGATGVPVFDQYNYMYGYNRVGENVNDLANIIHGALVTGQDSWKPLKTVFRTPENSGQQFVYIGILIETDYQFNNDAPLFINNFTYEAADILVQDERKDGLTIEQNFDSGFIGGIQKLRVYDKALTSPEILHNALIESKTNPDQNMVVSKGGRIIYR